MAVLFRVEGRRPDESETERIASLTLENSLPSEAEAAYSLKNFALMFSAGIVSFFVGRWALTNLRGLGALILGLGGLLVAPVCGLGAIYYFLRLFRSARKKTVAKAGEWFWVVSVMGDDASARFGKIDYALSTMRRILPKGMEFDEATVRSYVEKLRSAMADAADETAEMFRQAGYRESIPIVNFIPEETTEINSSLSLLRARLRFKDRLTKTDNKNKTITVIAAELELEITQYYIRSGKYWVPYDLTPTFSRMETVAQATESG